MPVSLTFYAFCPVLSPDTGDKRGRDELLLKQYLWRAFFTDRYENSAATHAYADFTALKKLITDQTKEDGTSYTATDVPIFQPSLGRS
jgi:hypothetical protein